MKNKQELETVQLKMILEAITGACKILLAMKPILDDLIKAAERGK